MASMNFSDTASQLLGASGPYLDAHLPMMQAHGNALFMGLALISISWYGIRVMLDGELTNVMGGLMRLMLFCGITYWLLNGGYQLVFVQGVKGSFDQLSTELLSVGGSGSDSNMVGAVVGMLWDAGSNILSVIPKLFPFSFNPLDQIAQLLNAFMVVIIVIFCAVVIMAAAVIYFVIAMFSNYMLTIALVFGPIFIPFILIPQLSFLWDGWLKFLISAALLKPVVAVIIGIFGAIFNSLATIIIQNANDFHAGSSIVAFLSAAISITLAAATLAYLLKESPGIASSLISGGSGVGGFSVPSVRGLMRTSKPASPAPDTGSK